MESIKLRKLSLKSKIGFGKHYNETVQYLLDSGKQDYLIWAYYNNSKITYLPQVLNQLDIRQIIEKPGTNETLHLELYPTKKKPIKFSKENPSYPKHAAMRKGKQYAEDMSMFSKRRLQDRNQGH